MICFPYRAFSRGSEFYGFCKRHCRRVRSLLVAKENQKTTSDFDALDP